MVTRKTQCTWMALGGLLCLFGVVLTCKIREGTPATAGDEKASLPVVPVPVPPRGEATKDRAEPMETDSTANAGNPPPAVPMDGAGTPLPPISPGMGIPAAIPEMVGAATGTRLTPPTAGAEVPVPPLSGPPVPPPGIPKPDVTIPPPGNPTTQAIPGIGLPPLGVGVSGPPASPIPNGTGALTGPPASPIPTTPPGIPTSPIVPTQGSLAAPVPAGPAPSGPPPLDPRRPEAITPMATQPRTEPGEPPLVPPSTPVQIYHVRTVAGETLRDIARRTLGASERWEEIARLNPACKPESVLAVGTTVRLPADACIPTEDVEAVKPLPPLRGKAEDKKPKEVQPLTGTFPCKLDDHKQLTLPRAIREQLGQKTLLVSPGPDHCLWITDTAHLERLAIRLENSPAREIDVRVFKRLYFAQTEKVAVSAEGRIQVSDRLAQFAGLHQEVVLVGIDDHFELWDVARWRQYTQEKSAAARTTTDSE
jgi:division/cell wall cluster transcriptional repressor MraZ